jgi:hypothetical protein
MNQSTLKKIFHFTVVVIFGFLGSRCATPQMQAKTYPSTEINLEKVFQENRGLRILEENATMIHDVYRGGVQEKEEGERLMKEGRWEEARIHLEKSIRFLRVVLKYLPDDEGYRNVYGDHMVIFMPNLLVADNDLNLITVYKKLGDENKAGKARSDGEYYLAESLKSLRTEWAYQLQNRYEEESPKK